MRLQKITVEGFESAVDKVTVDFQDNNMSAFVGENGAGKSMISIWAPIFALYGTTDKTRHRTLKEVISTNAGQAFVELDFSADNNQYRIIRKLPRIGAHEATLYVYDPQTDTWDIKGNKNPSSTNAAIEEIIGMNFDAAKTTFMALQGEYGLFAESLPSKRRSLLTQLLGLDSYEAYKESAEEKLKTAETEVASYQSQLEEMGKLREIISVGSPEFENKTDDDIHEELDELVEADQVLQQKEAEIAYKRDNAEKILEDAEKAKAHFEKSRNDRIAFIEENLEHLNSANDSRLRELRSEKEKIKEAKLHLTQISKELSTIETRMTKGETEIERVTQELQSITDQGTSAKVTLAAVHANIEELNSQKEALNASKEHAECLTCHQSLSKDLFVKVMGTLDNSLKEDQDKVTQLDAEIKNLKGAFREKQQLLTKFKDFFSQLQSSQKEKLSHLATLNQIISREELVDKKIVEEEQEFDKRAEKIANFTQELEQVQQSTVPQSVLDDIALAEKEVDKTFAATDEEFDYSGRNRIAALEKELAQRENAREKEAAFDSRKLTVERKLDAANLDVEQFTKLRKAFSPTGIPAMILAGAIPELEKDANEYLDKFSYGELSINIETERMYNKGTKSEEILINVNAPDGTREYSSFSGGQKFRIDLALRIAMCKVAARRTGSAAVETFFIDEGFGSLDSRGQLTTVAALTELSEEMAVIAVSHVNEIKEEFENLYEVSLSTGTTAIKQIKSADSV